MEILRFGPGQRRPVGPGGAVGLTQASIWSDPRAHVTELAFTRRALLPLQTSPDVAIFIIVSGGGWVQVGDERTAVNHGEAVVWPPGVAHGAWTDGSEMRAVLVEVPEHALPGGSIRLAGSAPGDAGRDAARGALAPRDIRPEEHDTSEGEPW